MSPTPVVYQSVKKFVQGPGVLETVGQHAASLCSGARACIVLDPGVRFLLETVASSLEAHGVRYVVHEFDGNLSRKHVDRLAGELRGRHEPGLFIGLGSGKAIDLSKMLANRTGARNLVAATAISTDAAPSHAAVGLDDGGHISAESYGGAPDLVLVDTEVIARAPVRLFVSGIGDAISKRHEMLTAVRLGENNSFGGRRPFFLDTMADSLHGTLLEKAAKARREVERRLAGPALEEVTTACVLLSALVWENGGLAGAHSVANVLFNSGRCGRSLHGEQVAFGLLLHLTLCEEEKELAALLPFYEEIGLPRRISTLGEEAGKADAIAEIARAVHQRWQKHRIHFAAERIAETIQALERA